VSLDVTGLSVDIGRRRIVDDVAVSVPDGHSPGKESSGVSPPPASL
jgi:hypothetical protein